MVLINENIYKKYIWERERLTDEFFFRWEAQEMCPWVVDIDIENQEDGAM